MSYGGDEGEGGGQIRAETSCIGIELRMCEKGIHF